MSATCCTVGDWVYPRGTIEYLRAEVTSDVLLDTQPVEVSLDGITWETGTWQGAAAFVRTVEVLYDFGDYYKGVYHVRVKITDTPEEPIIYVGSLEIVAA